MVSALHVLIQLQFVPHKDVHDLGGPTVQACSSQWHVS